MAATLCLTSALLMGDKPVPIRFFYRERPAHNNDSGFRFYSGLETDEFLGQQSSACVTPLDLVARLEPSLDGLLRNCEVGAVWEFCARLRTWLPVHDYRIPD